jgi:tRNA(Ile)-lysidine synthase
MFDTNLIKTNKNLLAFSAGVDSSALFFILMEKKIDFDIAIVDYNLRKQSKLEVQYAYELARKYDKKIFVTSYNQNKFSESLARDFRYGFFDKIINNNSYDALITAHQLNDKLEWFFMQLSKGAGLIELLNLQTQSQRKDYIVYKPLLEISKNNLLEYLQKHKFKYFIDDSNLQDIYKRNIIRNNFTNKFLDEYEDGIKQSFKYLQNDIKSLDNLLFEKKYEELIVAKFINNDLNTIIRFIDKKLKIFGIILSNATRDEIKKQKCITISNQFCIAIINTLVYISPLTKIVMDKKFKELCRQSNIPKNIRPYVYTLNKDTIDKLIDFK